MKVIKHLFLFLLISISARAQSLSVPELIDHALKNNPVSRASLLEIERQNSLRKTAFELPKTEATLLYGQYNSLYDQDNNLTLSQNIPFPTVFTSQGRLSKEKIQGATLQDIITKNELAFHIKSLVNQYLYQKAVHLTWMQYDSLYADMARVASVQYKTGEGTLLAKTLAETLWREIQDKKSRNEVDVATTLRQLQYICQLPELVDVTETLETLVDSSTLTVVTPDENPTVALARQEVVVSRWNRKAEAAHVLPDIRIGYFTQTLVGTQTINNQDQYFGPSKRFQGFQLGVAFPLWFVPSVAKVRAARLDEDIAEKKKENAQLQINLQFSKAAQDFSKNSKSLAYYKEVGLQTTQILMSQSKAAYRNGEIDYTTLLLSYRQALNTQENYWSAWQQYNQSIITLHYLNGTY